MERDQGPPTEPPTEEPRSLGDGVLYDADVHGWAEQQAALVRRGRWDLVDRQNLAEELEGLSRSEADKLRSCLRLILLHLLKYHFEPTRRSQSWRNTIGRERDNAALILEDNPSLKPKLPTLFAKAYHLARREAARETGLPLATFPADPPFTMAETLDDGFWPV